jgi:hypothetical protein
MPTHQIPALLAYLAALQSAVAARLQSTAASGRNGADAPEAGLITVEEAAHMAGVTREQFMRRVVFRPAIAKLGHRTTRVNEMQLRRILANLGS